MDYKKAIKYVQNVLLKTLSKQKKEELFKDIYAKIARGSFNIKEDQTTTKAPWKKKVSH